MVKKRQLQKHEERRSKRKTELPWLSVDVLFQIFSYLSWHDRRKSIARVSKLTRGWSLAKPQMQDLMIFWREYTNKHYKACLYSDENSELQSLIKNSDEKSEETILTFRMRRVKKPTLFFSGKWRYHSKIHIHFRCVKEGNIVATFSHQSGYLSAQPMSILRSDVSVFLPQLASFALEDPVLWFRCILDKIYAHGRLIAMNESSYAKVTDLLIN